MNWKYTRGVWLPDWFHYLVLYTAVIVIIVTSLDLALCPPCQLCIGRIGQVCIEDVVEVPLPAISGVEG